MGSSWLQLAPGSRDLFQAEKRITVMLKLGKCTKWHSKLSWMNKVVFWVKIVVNLLSLQLIILFVIQEPRKQTGTHVYHLRCVQIPTMLDIREALKKSVLPKRKQDQIELSKNRKHILKKRNEQRLQDQMNAVKKSWIYSAWLLGLRRLLINNQTTIIFYLKILHFFTNT